jgi:hypothetical protein
MRIRNFLKRAHRGRILSFHIPFFLRLSIGTQTGPAENCIPFGTPVRGPFFIGHGRI